MGFTLEQPCLQAVLTSTNDRCFASKVRKIGIPMYIPVLLYESGVYGGIVIFVKNHKCFFCPSKSKGH